MKKRWAIREAALLLLPVAALAAYGLWTRDNNSTIRQHSRPTGRYEFTLQSVEVAPATPRDVYEGFDTLVMVKYVYPSAPKLANSTPSAISIPNLIDPRLIYRDGDKFQRVGAAQNGKPKGMSYDFDKAIFRLRLLKIPAKYGALTFKSGITGGHYLNVTGANGKLTVSALRTPILPISVVVRKAGEVVETPQVSKHRPFKVKTIGFDALRSQRRDGTKTIEVVIENLEPTDKDSWRFLHPRLVDARGREYEYSIKVGKQYVSWVQMLTPADHLVDKQDLVRWFSFPLNLIPKSAGKITFKTEISLDDCWPLPISYVVRP